MTPRCHMEHDRQYPLICVSVISASDAHPVMGHVTGQVPRHEAHEQARGIT